MSCICDDKNFEVKKECGICKAKFYEKVDDYWRKFYYFWSSPQNDGNFHLKHYTSKYANRLIITGFIINRLQKKYIQNPEI